MKKIISLLFGCLLLFSCQIEELNKADQQLDGTFFKNSQESESTSCTNSLDLIASSLPETVNFCTDGQGPEAYLNISINEGFLAGDYGSWCIDDDLSIEPILCYDDVPVFLSTGTLPEGAFEYPENFDAVNWLLNQNIVGSESPTSSEIYTYGDLQFAIWKLLDDLRDPSEACTDCGLGEWSAVRAGELVLLALDNGDGFMPGCNEFVGIILRPDGNIQPLIIPYKIVGEECSPCDGKVSELSLKYNGDQTDAHIIVSQKKDDVVVFDEIIQPGESFSFVGVDKKNTLGTEIIVEVNGVVNTKIHTSCSQPIGPGLIFGDFVVIAGASRNGGALCPLVPPPGGGDDCAECEGKVTRLDFEYGGPASDVIKVTDKKGEEIIYNGTITDGMFTINGFDKKGTLGTEIIIYINGTENTNIHTSCSQPIGPGLSFGDFTVVGGASREGGELCPLDPPPGGGDDCAECEGKVTRLDLTYNGAIAADITVKDKKGENEIVIGTVNPGDTFTIDGASGVFDDKKGTLGTEISIYIDGSENTNIHTSCSQPIDTGLSFGDFTVVGGASRGGGEFCEGPI
jgi:hypothetical protein